MGAINKRPQRDGVPMMGRKDAALSRTVHINQPGMTTWRAYDFPSGKLLKGFEYSTLTDEVGIGSTDVQRD